MIKIMMSGLPGKMADAVAREADTSEDIDVIPIGLTKVDDNRGGAVQPVYHGLANKLLMPYDVKEGDHTLTVLGDLHPGFIAVDYTHSSAIESNSEMYCRTSTPFVMGTTGGTKEERAALEQRVRDSNTVAVIAPNMAKQIVAFQALMDNFSENHLDIYKDCTLKIIESHQKGKPDTSGTARAMVGYFNKMGIRFDESDIIKIRDPEEQLKMGVPQDALTGHGWHTYTVSMPGSAHTSLHLGLSRALEGYLNNNDLFGLSRFSGKGDRGNLTMKNGAEDGSSLFMLDVKENEQKGYDVSFTHNINGRRPYALGTLDAIRFLDGKVKAGVKGEVFTMMDVLR